MLRQALTGTAAVAAVIVALFLINAASLLLLPSCSIEQIVPNGSKQNTDAERDDKFCPLPEGIVSAGFEQIGDLFSPEVWTAVATIIMAIFTGILSLVAYQQIQLTRSEFLATNRPVLRVRYFRQTAGTHDQIQIRFAVVNAGKSRAHLQGSSVVVDFFDPDKLGPPVYLAGQDSVTPRQFEVGASDDYCALGTEKGAQIQNNENYGKFLFIYGYLVYSDDAGTTRRTAFGRRYLRARERFIKIEDDDYEYED